MKNMLRMIAALLIAVMCLTGAALAAGKIKTTGDVNIRKGPGLDYKTVGSISSGSTAKYLFETKKDERGVKWYKVSYNGKTGWISSKYSKIV